MTEIKRITEVSLTYLSLLTGTPYRTLYDRFHAGTLKGFKRDDRCFITINDSNEYFNIIHNFLVNTMNNNKIEFKFIMGNKEEIDNNPQSFVQPYSELYDVLDALHKLPCIQPNGATVWISYVVDEDKKLVYFKSISIFDEEPIASYKQYDSDNKDLEKKQNQINNEVDKLIHSFQTNCNIYPSRGFGGSFNVIEKKGRISAHQAYYLCLHQ